MIYLSVQPDIAYFHWQVETYITNFKSVGINPNNIEVIFIYDQTISKQGLALQQKYNTVRFFFYKNDMPDKSYIPAIKPYGFFKHLQQYPDLNKVPIFYHDADIIFRERINEKLFTNDNNWYLSDTVSYIGYDYCISKGTQQFLDMVDDVHIHRETVIRNQNHSGGAQYIIKNTKASFWYKVYEDSITLYNTMLKHLNMNTDAPSPIQKWCAEMWSTLWNAWLFNYNTIVHDELNFTFATNDIDKWFSTKIMHNAGVVDDKANLFFKGGFINKSPFYENFDHITPTKCSFKYVEAIKAVQH